MNIFNCLKLTGYLSLPSTNSSSSSFSRITRYTSIIRVLIISSKFLFMFSVRSKHIHFPSFKLPSNALLKLFSLYSCDVLMYNTRLPHNEANVFIVSFLPLSLSPYNINGLRKLMQFANDKYKRSVSGIIMKLFVKPTYSKPYSMLMLRSLIL